MASYGVVVLEGVLCVERGEFPSVAPIQAGLNLWHALRSTYKLIIATDHDHAKAEHWLGMHRVNGYTSLQPLDGCLEDLRSMSYDLDLYIDSSPARVAAGMHMGIAGLVFAHPQFARPEFRPDVKGEIREWGAIEAEMEIQNKLAGEVRVKTADLDR